jgi:superfamily II DNA or RNA helicase
MLKSIEYPASNEYRSGTPNEPINFFLEALENSISFDLLLGYFSSSAINVLSLGFAHFIHRGGKVRIIANHILSVKDKEAVITGSQVKEDAFFYNVNDYQKILKSLDEYGAHFFNCLAWLIASKRIEMKVVKPKDSRGIAHYKSGVFYDGNEKVKFKSSCNFTAFGLLENLEELEVKQSWNSKSDSLAIAEQERYFNEIFNEEADFVEYIPFEEIEEVILKDFGGKEIDELLIDEVRLVEKRKAVLENENTRIILERLKNIINSVLDIPQFPYPEPRDYQVEAYNNWVMNNHKGVFAMATGTGKTLTALNCVLNEYKERGNYRALILVPTIELVAQWREEIQKFKFKNTVSVSSANKDWRNDLKRINALSKKDSTFSFFIVTTYRSFISPRFQTVMQNFPTDTIFIADEAHNCGSPSVLRLLENVPLQKRIGLSATPERIYDIEGTAEVDDFFDDARPYTYEFSMEQALELDFLCKYYYYPFLVELTAEELEKYVEISIRLGRCFGSDNEEMNDVVKRLLLARKQIIHKATNKLTFYDDLIQKLSSGNQLKNTLVYAPEGYFNELFLERESLEHLDMEETRICDVYSSRIRSIAPETKVALFNGASKNRGFILNQFSSEIIDVLVSMKCLDEGVDVPRTERAIFCASTGNPRQFIQRRGRILRNHDDKNFATIYDLVVVPSVSNIVGDANIERKMIENELRRVQEFANLALNRHEALDEFQNIISMYNINSIF